MAQKIRLNNMQDRMTHLMRGAIIHSQTKPHANQGIATGFEIYDNRIEYLGFTEARMASVSQPL